MTKSRRGSTATSGTRRDALVPEEPVPAITGMTALPALGSPVPRNPFDDESSSNYSGRSGHLSPTGGGYEYASNRESRTSEAATDRISPRGTRIFDDPTMLGALNRGVSARSKKGDIQEGNGSDGSPSRESSVRVRRSQIWSMQRDSLPANLGKLNRWLSMNRQREKAGEWPLRGGESEKGASP